MSASANGSRERVVIVGGHVADSLLLIGLALDGAGRLAIPSLYFLAALFVTNFGRYLLLRKAAFALSCRQGSCPSANAQIDHESTHDALTNLANRALFFERLEEAVEQGIPFALAVLDLDRFKIINDSLGRGAGDSMLKIVAQRLLSSTRAADTVARTAGDEFLILIHNAHAGVDLKRLSARWMEALSEPYRIRSAELHVSASIGIARYPDDASTARELLAHADEAMCHAKQSGRNRLCSYDALLMGGAHARLTLESELRQALDARQFELLYQPMIDVTDDAMCGVEALLRWQHPSKGRLAPDEFMSIAEDCGLMVPIGAWAIDEACRQARAWKDKGDIVPRVAINISPTQFRQLDFAKILQHTLARHRLPASCLQLSIAETTLMGDAGKSACVLEQLSRLGVAVAIDDFGTGYSSVSCLRRFPIETLNIHPGFIGRLQTHADDASIVRAIIALAHGLGLRVAAQGVECAAQLDILRRMGCDQYQGLVRSTAVPAAAIERQLAAGRAHDAKGARPHAGVSRVARLVHSSY